MQFGKYILWCQSAVPTDEDTLTVDGMQPSGAARSEAFAFLNTGNFSVVNGKKHIWRSVVMKWFAGKIAGVSPSFALYWDCAANLLVRSHFLDVDNSGRPIVYMCCLKCSHVSNAGEMLRQAADSVGRECNPADVEMTEYVVSRFRKLKYMLYGLATIIAIAVAVVLKVVLTD